MRSASQAVVVLLLSICLLNTVPAQTRNDGSRSNGGRPTRSTAAEPINGKTPVSEMRASIERYAVDRGSLARSYPVGTSLQEVLHRLARVAPNTRLRRDEPGRQSRLHTFQKPSRIRTTTTRHPRETTHRNPAANPVCEDDHRARRSASSHGAD